jgi:glycosyltransferase involved in cell wall biosynthesis
VAIGLPVHNGADHLAAALESLLSQTWDDLEIIVADNASTDGTGGIARAYAARDPRIRYFHEPVNRGAIWNFNRVLELAQSPYFKWHAHDDLCDPAFVERCVAVLDRDPTVAVCHTRTRKIDLDGAPRDDLPDPTTASAGGADRRPAARFRDVLLHTGYGVRCYGVFRAQTARRVKPLLPIYGSEKVFMAEIALHGRIVDLDEVLFYERIHPDEIHARDTARGQQRFVAPQERARPLPRFQLLKGYAEAVGRAPIGAAERVRCLLAIGAYLLQTRKWPGVARSALAGTGFVHHERHEAVAVSAGGNGA